MSHFVSLHVLQIVCLSCLKVLIRFRHLLHDRCASRLVAGELEDEVEDMMSDAEVIQNSHKLSQLGEPA